MMTTLLTPAPIVVEVRNAAGQVLLDLADGISTTTVDVQSLNGGAGLLDDVLRAFGRRGRDADDAVVTETDDQTEAVRVELTEPDPGRPAVLVIDTEPARSGWRTSFLVRITAPAGSSVRLAAQSADVQVLGQADRVEVRASSGDVQIGRGTGRVVVQTASGDIRVGAAESDLDARTASGDLTIGRVLGSATLHTTSGSIRVEAVERDVTARSVSGDVRIGETATGHTEVRAVSGNVDVGIRPGRSAHLDVSTVAGTAVSEFEVGAQAPAGPVADPPLDLFVRTTSGDVRLRRMS